MLLPRLPEDKAQHWVYGSILASLGALHSVGAGLMLCAGFAIGWELYQRLSKHGHPSVLDAIATIGGGMPVLVPLAVWRITQ